MECVAGCGSVEWSAHLLLHCNLFGYVWHLMYRWLSISAVVPRALSDHFIQFCYSGGPAKTRQSILQVLWFATVWEIWKDRNNMIFTDKACSVNLVADKIKSLTFMWLNEKFSIFPFNYHGWWLSSFTLMGIG